MEIVTDVSAVMAVLLNEPERAAEKIARFVVSFAKGIEGAFEAPE